MSCSKLANTAINLNVFVYPLTQAPLWFPVVLVSVSIRVSVVSLIYIYPCCYILHCTPFLPFLTIFFFVSFPPPCSIPMLCTSHVHQPHLYHFCVLFLTFTPFLILLSL